jgi:hypothetical protein
VKATARLLGVAVSVAVLVTSPGRVVAAAPSDGAITPESTNAARFEVEQQGQQLRERGDLREAAELYWTEGVRLKDPVLILDSAEALRDHAAEQRSIEHAEQAIDRAAPALDMLYFLRDRLRDQTSAAAWQPLAAEHLDTVITRAEALVRDANALIRAIEDEQRRAAEASTPEPEPEPERRAAKPGTGLIAAGSAATVLGLAGAGLGIAGLVLGAQAQAEVEDPLVYEPEHSAAEARGESANVLAGVGLAVAGVGLGVGAALIVLGLKKRKRAGAADPELSVVPLLFNHGPERGLAGGGFGLAGSF